MFSVGLGTLGAGYELERLRVLAERTGGTYRLVDKEENLLGAVASTMGELTGGLAIEFTHQEPEEVGKSLDFKVEVELDPGVVAGETKFASAVFSAALPVPPTWQEGLERAIRATLVAVQEAIGYKLYVAALTAIAVLAGLIAMLVGFLLVRAVVRKVRS